MKLASISFEYKEKRNTVEVTVYSSYFVKDKKGHTYEYTTISKATIKKLTKKEIIKATKN